MVLAMQTPKVLVVFGTRPEAIKLSPLVAELKKRSDLETMVCLLRQQPRLAAQSLAQFGVEPEADIAFPFGNAGLFSNSLFKRIVSGFKILWGLFRFFRLVRKERPNLIVIQGDTSTALFTALLAYHLKIKVAHIEAGLRTHDKYAPFPEEMNRRLISVIADIHFASTEAAKENLLREGIDGSSIFVTGNTVMDAVRLIAERQENAEAEKLLDEFFRKTYNIDLSRTNGKMVFFTTHRRESFGKEMENIMRAVKKLVDEHEDVFVVYPMHPNPNVIKTAHAVFRDSQRIHFIDSVRYDRYLFLLKKAHFIITDSGGLQEEISYFGTPTIVARNVTERSEGLSGGNLLLAGTDTERILGYALRLLHDHEFRASVSKKHAAFGDGHAAERIAKKIAEALG